MKTYQPKHKDITRNWHLVDVGGEILGRKATQIATFLMGKHKPNYSNHMDMGDYVVVVNAAKVKLTGRKEQQKVYFRHSGYPKGLREIKFSTLREEQPEKVIRLAVSRMLPKNRLQDQRLSRLKVFAENKHDYEDKLVEKTKK